MRVALTKYPFRRARIQFHGKKGLQSMQSRSNFSNTTLAGHSPQFPHYNTCSHAVSALLYMIAIPFLSWPGACEHFSVVAIPLRNQNSAARSLLGCIESLSVACLLLSAVLISSGQGWSGVLAGLSPGWSKLGL